MIILEVLQISQKNVICSAGWGETFTYIFSGRPLEIRQPHSTNAQDIEYRKLWYPIIFS